MAPVDVENFARRFPDLASNLTTDEAHNFLRILKRQEFEASEALIDEGTLSDSLFLVWDGALDVLTNTPDGERKVAQLGPGEFFGEISVLSPGPTTATVRSEQGCTALHLTRSNLEQFWQQYPHVATVFMQELSRLVARRIRAADEMLNQLLLAGDFQSDTLIAVHTKLLKEAK